jgi:hydroxylamine reductase (hybrid-cluster protein)
MKVEILLKMRLRLVVARMAKLMAPQMRESCPFNAPNITPPVSDSVPSTFLGLPRTLSLGTCLDYYHFF